MSFTPPPFLQAPSGGEYRPMRVRLTTSLSGSNYQGGDQSMVQTLSDAILQNHAAEISGWVNGLRQQTAISPIKYLNRHMHFIDCRCEYTRNDQDEILDITVLPNPPNPQPGSVPNGGTYDVICPFTGYAVGQLNTLGLYTWAGWNLLDDDTLTNDDAPFSKPAPWGVPSVGRTGVLTTPLNGLQYLEAEIVKLPAAVPPSFRVPYSGVDDGSFIEWDVAKLQQDDITYKFPTGLNTWLTPAIGFIPKQQVKDTWTGNVTVDDMLVGLEDDDVFQVARSVYCVTSTIQYSDVNEKFWQGAQYWINNPSQIDTAPQIGVHTLTVPSEGTTVTKLFGHAPGAPFEARWNIRCQIMEADWNPIYIANVPVKPTITVGGGMAGAKQIPPIVRGDEAGVGVAGKYLLIPSVTLTQMPINTFTVGDIPGAIAAQDTKNKNDIDDLIAADDALGNTDTYTPIEAFADPRLTGFEIPAADPYLHGTANLWFVVSEPGVFTDIPTPIDDTVFISGGFQNIKQLLGDLGYQAGFFLSQAFDQQAITGDYFESRTSNVTQNSGTIELVFNPLPANTIAFAYEANPGLTPPTGANVVGTHTWVLKGRGDLLGDANTATDDGPLVPPLGGDGALFNGVWSGVDLGHLALDDVIMLAVDTSTRQVWFGKNGKWYDKHGVSPYVPGNVNLLPAMLLDGETSQDYYPAATLRAGQSQVRFQWGVSTKYQRPGGFDDYVG